MKSCSSACISSLVVAVLCTCLPVHAGPDPQDVVISMSDVAGASPGASGVVALKSDPISTDDLRIMVSGLAPNTTHAVFLAASRETGSLPVQFVGELTTDARGSAFFSASTEVVNAYAPANPGATGADGTAPRLAGVLARGGFNVPLDFIRIYRASTAPGGSPTVFTRDGVSPGGIHVLSTDAMIPQEVPSAQFLYNIVANHSQKCVAVQSADPANGLAIQQQTCNGPGQRNQLFRFVPTGSGSFEIHPQNSLKCLEIQGASQADVAPAVQMGCRGIRVAQQQFRLMPMGTPGFFNIMAMHSGKCLDVAGISLDDGAPVIQFQCLGAGKTNQLFRITRADAQ